MQEALQSSLAESGSIQADWAPNVSEDVPVASPSSPQDPAQGPDNIASNTRDDGVPIPHAPDMAEDANPPAPDMAEDADAPAPDMAEDAMSLPDSPGLRHSASASAHGSDAGVAKSHHAQRAEDAAKQKILTNLLAKGSKMIQEDAARRQAAEKEAARVAAAAEASTAEGNTARARLADCMQRLMQLAGAAAEAGLDAASAFLHTPTGDSSAAGTAVIGLMQQKLGSLLLMVDCQEQAGNLAVAIGMLSTVRLPVLFLPYTVFPCSGHAPAVTFYTSSSAA